MQPPEPIDPNFRIQLPTFEGPLDLLLHLIKKHELDILDLPIAFVTESYLSYLGLMKELNLDVAAEYLVMAATLAHIKSKMLLPTPPEDQDDELEDEGDPREELIRRLLEYQKYKLAAEGLGSRSIAGRDVFGRGTQGPAADGPAPLADMGLFKLLDAFSGVLERATGKLAFEITAERISIQERISQIVDLLAERRTCHFEELFEGVATKYDVVVTFLAMLELAKMRMMRIYQTDPTAPIHLEYRVLAADDAEESGADASGPDLSGSDSSGPDSAGMDPLAMSGTDPDASTGSASDSKTTQQESPELGSTEPGPPEAGPMEP